MRFLASLLGVVSLAALSACASLSATDSAEPSSTSSGAAGKGASGASNSGSAGAAGAQGPGVAGAAGASWPSGGAAGGSDFGGSGGAEAANPPPDPGSEACRACLQAVCSLDCSQLDGECDPCTVQPDSCYGGKLLGELGQCACTGACQTLCKETSYCSTADKGDGGSSGQGGQTGGFAGNGNGSGTGAASGGAPEFNCSNGVDDNGDEQVDCDDPTCQPACKDACASPTSVQLDDLLNPSWSSPGLWTGHASSFLLNCSPSSSSGPSIAYSFTNASGKKGFVQVQASSVGGDVVLARLASCGAGVVELDCRNTSGPGGSEGLTFELLPNETATLVVASASAKKQGLFQISASFSVPVCGDGVVSPGEECDSLISEGCSEQCKVTACDGATAVLDGVDGVIHKTSVSSEVITPSCAKLGKGSPEFVYSIRAKNAGLLQAILRSKGTTDLNLSLRSSCQSDSEVACADLMPGGEGALERVVLPVTAGQLLFPVVDAYDGSQAGDFDLFARSYPDECGDGVVSPLEQCDGVGSCSGDCTTTLPEGTAKESEPNELAGLASVFKGTMGGKIAPAGDVDLYLVDVTKAGLLKVWVDEPGDGSCKRGELSVVPEGVLDSELKLMRQDGSLVAINDNGAGDGFCSRVEAKVAVGSYLVQVRASPTAPSQVFSYLLKVETP